jgi:hypothetical protein
MAFLTSKAALPKGRFLVEADDMPSISFKMAEGLKMGVTISRYLDGMDQEAMLKFGKSEYDNLVLTAGEALESLQPWYQWYDAIRNASANGGLVGEDLMKTIDVVCQRDDGSTALTVRNELSLLASIEMDSRDADSADTAVDKMEVAVTRRNVIFGSGTA